MRRLLVHHLVHRQRAPHEETPPDVVPVAVVAEEAGDDESQKKAHAEADDEGRVGIQLHPVRKVVCG